MRTGRPKEENAKRKTITIRLTEDLYRKIVEYAAEHKLSKDRCCPAKLGEISVQERLSAVESFFIL